MAINIRKPAKVNLVKGQRINLTKDATKDGDSVRYAFVGSNWSSLRNGRSVDLDSSILVYDENKNLIDVVYYRNLVSEDHSIKHSGDDREGDAGGVMDAYDNEVITIDLSKITPKACYLVSILNSYSGHNFGEIPGIELRIYTNNTGNWRNIDEVIASYKLDNNKDFEGDVAIVLGHFYKHNNSWKFSADGIGTKEKDIPTIARGSARKVID